MTQQLHETGQRMTAEQEQEIRTRADDARRDLDQCGATTYRTRTFVADIAALLRELDAVRAERDDLSEVVTGLRAEVKSLTRERDEARRAEAVAIPEPLAADVLDDIEAAIAAGRAMGHGAWAILNRLWRLLQPQLRADASRFTPTPEAP